MGWRSLSCIRTTHWIPSRSRAKRWGDCTAEHGLDLRTSSSSVRCRALPASQNACPARRYSHEWQKPSGSVRFGSPRSRAIRCADHLGTWPDGAVARDRRWRGADFPPLGRSGRAVVRHPARASDMDARLGWPPGSVTTLSQGHAHTTTAVIVPVRAGDHRRDLLRD
jgi:hypothetical protein